VKGRDVLATLGGWILVGFGITLIALSAIFADKTAIAPVFAFGGIACVVIGVLVARIEGEFELTPASLRAQLSAVTTVARSEELTLEEKGDQIVEIVAGSQERLEAALTRAMSQAHASVASTAADRLERTANETAARGGPAQTRGYRFEQAVADYFLGRGFEVEQTRDFGFDLVARKPGEETRFVQAKAVRHLSRADVERLITLASVDQAPDGIVVLATLPGSLTANAREALGQAGPRFEVVEIAAEA
jgi:hypothetical protein